MLSVSPSFIIDIHYRYARSLKAKTCELECLILAEGPDVRSVGETWLHDRKQKRIGALLKEYFQTSSCVYIHKQIKLRKSVMAIDQLFHEV